MQCLRPNFAKRGGLVTVVAQDVCTKEVLMVASANEEAWRKTLETGIAHYWSTSRNRLWKKGEESGHVQIVLRVLVDCDGDAVLYLVEPKGPACHTAQRSCFYRDAVSDVARAAFPSARDALAVVDIPVNLGVQEKGVSRD
ncbi:MAG: phosphoribosyl-AMP cyclohydrolase [Patescibacteria group bacterium]|nr:phosphoribosyl-AMP cyclohydrolase [Patescibacteria group bacterium]